jgi:succinate dehydrogenase / fumarate reductase flavoprotein subunit
LGGNSLSDLLVFGRLAGVGAAGYVKKWSATESRVSDSQVETAKREATAPLNRESGKNPYLVHEELQNIMEQYVGIVRTKSELETGIFELEKLKKSLAELKTPGASQYNPGWHEALSLKNLMVAAEAVARAALTREESRGGHTRLDFFEEREEGLKYNVVIRKGPSGMEVRKEPRPEPPEGLKRIAYAKVEDLEAGRV